MEKFVLLAAAAGGLIFAARASVTPAFADEGTPTIVVYKSPTCGCCSRWVKHLEDNGFKVESHSTTDMASVKDKFHVPKDDRSCHTARVGKYIIEGHVPADDIKKLLKESPSGVVGLAVPKMPIGAPGMESDDPAQNEHYDVVSFDSDGNGKVFDHK